MGDAIVTVTLSSVNHEKSRAITHVDSQWKHAVSIQTSIVYIRPKRTISTGNEDDSARKGVMSKETKEKVIGWLQSDQIRVKRDRRDYGWTESHD